VADRREVVLPGRLSPEEMFPAGDNRFRVQIVRLFSGEQIRVIECGPQDSEDIVFCVHGWGCSVYSYRGVLPKLAERGRRAIAIDLRGHGLSEKREQSDLYTIDALARLVAEVCDQLGIQHATFVGHSMGSGTLARFAELYPRYVRALVLTAPVGFEKTFDIRAAIQATPGFLVPILPKLVSRSLIQFVIRKAYGNKELVTERDVEEYWAPSQFPAFARITRTLLHIFDWTAGGHGCFQGISAPLTVVYGTKDSIVPPRAALRYGDVVRGATFIRLDGIGHAIPDEAPDRVVEAILKTP
jgi:pimeloyl-ACP methyl ester carboxylesterase